MARFRKRTAWRDVIVVACADLRVIHHNSNTNCKVKLRKRRESNCRWLHEEVPDSMPQAFEHNWIQPKTEAVFILTRSQFYSSEENPLGKATCIFAAILLAISTFEHSGWMKDRQRRRVYVLLIYTIRRTSRRLHRGCLGCCGMRGWVWARRQECEN